MFCDNGFTGSTNLHVFSLSKVRSCVHRRSELWVVLVVFLHLTTPSGTATAFYRRPLQARSYALPTSARPLPARSCPLRIAALVGVAALHKTVLTRHIVTAIPYLFFPLAYFVAKMFSGEHAYGWAALIGSLFLLSAARVYYVMNSHFSRSLGDPFIFLRELPTFLIFYGFTAVGLVLWLAVRKSLGAMRKDVTT